jgi:hypothetical protein
MSMTRETTYSGILGSWQRTLNVLTANTGDLGHLETSRVKLEGIFQRAQEIAKEQAALTASRQEQSQQLKVLIQEGQRVMSVLRVSLKDHYGPRAEKLAEFGIQPFRGRKPKPAAEPEPGTEVPDPVTPESHR